MVDADDHHQGVMRFGQLAKEPGRIPAPFVVGPPGRVEPQRGLNHLAFGSEGQTPLLLPISPVGVDGVVRQRDRVHHVKLGPKPSSQVGCHRQGALARRARVIPQNKMNGAQLRGREIGRTKVIAGRTTGVTHEAPRLRRTPNRAVSHHRLSRLTQQVAPELGAGNEAHIGYIDPMILDVGLPGLDGFGILRTLQGDHQVPLPGRRRAVRSLARRGSPWGSNGRLHRP
jgi:CheY-like chemotaxis protein